MGYEVQIKQSTAVLLNKDRDQILQAWKDLNKPENNHLKKGGSWSQGKRNAWWYSWLSSNYDQTVNSVEDMLNELGFEFVTCENGDVKITGYEGKTGQEKLFFKEVYELLTGHIEWVGEDGCSWNWVFGPHGYFDFD